MKDSKDRNSPLVGLFITCAVDLFRPSVGFASITLLENAGCRVTVPAQGCCGQVGYNNGLIPESRDLARKVIDSFSNVDYVVAPSGSCASMLKNHYPGLFSLPEDIDAANRFSDKVHELTCFLHDIMDYKPTNAIPADDTQSIVYHDSCAGLRELGIQEQPRHLVRSCRAVQVKDIVEGDVCCGFGGTFCVKFEAIADKMVADKARNVARQNPDMLLGGDLTCLLHIGGKLAKQGNTNIEVRHVAEFLAGNMEQPSIGRGK